jgi:N-acetylglucosaminyl-diphospho-decaprenol L-rhamnosyltransferase
MPNQTPIKSTGPETNEHPDASRAVVVVVVTHNNARHVDALLDSLPAAFGDLRYQTVVVDNASTDNTLDVLGSRLDCTVIPNSNSGFAAGVNLGVRHGAGHGPILVLNPDATLEPGAVAAMCRVLAQPDVGVVAPRVVEADGRLSPSLRREPTLGRAGGLSFTGLPAFSERVDNARDYEREHVVDWAMGAILLIDRECYDSMSGLDESYFLYSEETDFCLRARDAGWSTLYTPDAGAMHIGGGSGESEKTHTMRTINRIRIYRRRTGPTRAWIYYLLSVGVEVRRGIMGEHWAWATARALVRPALRPTELNCNDRVIPD